MELKSFERLLQKHDWYYAMADGKAFWDGKQSEDQIRSLMRQMWVTDPISAEKAHKLFTVYSENNRIKL